MSGPDGGTVSGPESDTAPGGPPVGDGQWTSGLARWLPQQRWFPAKGTEAGEPSLRSTVELAASPGERVLLHTVAVAPAGASQLLSVPLVYRRVDGDGGGAPAQGAEVMRLAQGDATWRVTDGPHDPAFVAALVDLLGGVSAGEGDATASGHLAASASAPPRGAPSKVLGGEQSNTSIIISPPGATAVIVKLFRVLDAGDNPDVVVQAALAQVGCDRIPAPVGWVSGTWPDPRGNPVAGHLAVAAEFVAGAQDAWREALGLAETGTSFAAGARDLGAATGDVHAALASALPTETAGAEQRAGLVAALRERTAWAVDAAPSLAEHAEALHLRLQRSAAAVEATGDDGGGLALQQVHGDYHLGQVLHSPERGWVLLDFEGEPLRPLAERTRPDLALRDVAGMLRSFDYAAATAARAGTDEDAASAWREEAREAFCEGYAASTGSDPRARRELLDALELDKAVYEVVYETRNRPAWVDVPLRAVRRLLHDGSQPATPETCEADPMSSTDAAPTPTTDAPRPRPVVPSDLHRIGAGEHSSPHSVLGGHVDLVGGAATDGPAPSGVAPSGDASAPPAVPTGQAAVADARAVVTLRALAPFADAVVALTEGGGRTELSHEAEGVWVGVLPGDDVTDYRLEVTRGSETSVVDDPYRYLPTISEFDLHLISEGRHEELWGVLGAHVRRWSGPMGDVIGTSFAVWAPHARAVRVIGDFNGWDGRRSMMRSMGSSGVWEVFLPSVGKGATYKFALQTQGGHWVEKADPMARATEVPPATASVVDESEHTWSDDAWMDARVASDPHTGPLSVYEVHLGSWRQGLSYREAADALVEHVTATGFTHVELLPVAEHPFGGSWGYQVTGYYAPTSRFGSPDDFRYLVDTLHRADIGVIVDWVPAHFPKDEFALARFDGEPLYEYPDPRKGEHPDWGTLVFDFGRREVRNFLVANAVYWLAEFHVDALRVDAVASMLYLDYSREDGQWIPNRYGGREHLEAIDFLQEVNATAYKRVPGIMMIAEESTAWPGVSRPTDAGGLGFGLKWNMGWMHDSLSYLAEDPVNRTWHHDEVTFALVYAFTENFVLPISHDEVVHGKGSMLRKVPGDRWQQVATLRAFYAYMWSHPGKQLLFMGQEFGQEAEWAEGRSLDWWLLDQPLHAGLMRCVADLNAFYRATPAMWDLDFTGEGFAWIDGGDRERDTFSYLRTARDGSQVAVAVNFAGNPHEGYRLGLPETGTWREVLNTDAEVYGGSGVVNGSVEAVEGEHTGQPAHATLRIPPLGAVYLVHDED